jgi:tetratricopeptide (TPR) repeat protein
LAETITRHGSESQHPGVNDRLDSWKEIACYLRRALRTVQLWERNEGLPVHRHTHNALGSVYAFRSELDAWWMGPRPQSSVRKRRFMIAALPLVGAGDDPKREERLGKGLASEILVQLTCLCPPEIGAFACRSTMRFKDSTESVDKIAGALGATHLIEGTVRCEGERILVTVQLIDARDQSHVWAESYLREHVSGLVLEKDLSVAIALSVAAKLVPKRRLPVVRTCGSSAHQYYVKGRFYWNMRTAESLAKAIGCFEQALHEDPRCALAYSGLADSYVQMGFYGITSPQAATHKAKAAAVRALELDEMSGEAHASLADIMTYFEWDLAAADQEYRRAIQLSPTYATAYQWYADYLAIMGRLDEAIVNGQRALEIDPVSPIISVWLGMKYYVGGLYQEAVDQCGRTLEMHPNYALAHWAFGLALEQQEMYDQAIIEKRKAVDMSNNSMWMVAGLAYSYALSGKQKEARKIVDRLTTLPRESSALSYELATVYAGMLNQKEAIRWLEQAYQNRSVWMPYINVEPRLKGLHRDPGFKNLVGRFELAHSPKPVATTHAIHSASWQ